MFDTVVSCATFEHIENLSVTISELKKHLKSDGSMVITTPSPRSKFIQELLALTRLFHKENIEGHNYLSKEDLAALGNMVFYRRFQLGMNQIAVFKNK